MEFHNLDEIAQKFKISKSTLYNFIQTGRLKTKKIGRRYYIAEADLFAIAPQAATGARLNGKD